jgi:very-short-patch-repair endonuclease
MKNLTNGKFIEKAVNVHNNEYDYSLVNYINCKIKINIICKKHGVFSQIPSNHLSGTGCPICGKINSNLKKKMSIDDFINKATKMHKGKYNYSSINYNGAYDYVNIICPIHGDYRQLGSSHLSGKGCSKCVGGVKGTQEDFISKAKEIHDNEYDYSLVKYINAIIKVKIMCPIHGVFKQSPSKHLLGQGCPTCMESKGEKEIAKYLLKNSINFEREKKFDGCNGKRRVLSFDFYIPDKNVLIEFDGRQHYMLVNFHGCSDEQAQKTYFELKKNDEIKNNFANLNNYHLLRINYNEINDINNILETYEPISQR